MDRPAIFAIVAGALGIALPSASNAYCPGTPKDYTVAREFNSSKYVVEAIADQEIWLGEDGKPKALQPPFQSNQSRPWGFDPYMGAYFDMRVLSNLKGNPPKRLRLFSENSTARFWLKTGTKYLLFVTEAKFDPPIGRALTVDTCGNSAELKGHSTLRRKLKALAH